MKYIIPILASAAMLSASISANAATVVLDFSGVATPSDNITTVGDFYNGGVSGSGTSGTN